VRGDLGGSPFNGVEVRGMLFACARSNALE
jgi:hypothetical protein